MDRKNFLLPGGEVDLPCVKENYIVSEETTRKTNNIIDNNYTEISLNDKLSKSIDRIKKSIIGIFSNQNISRREFIKKMLILTGTLALSNSSNVFSHLKTENKELVENQDKIETELEKYYEHNKHFFSKISFRKQYRKGKKVLRNSRYKRNYDTRVIPKMKNLPKELLYKVRNKDLEKGLDKLGFVEIAEETDNWRLFGIGHKTKVKDKNSYLRIQAKKALIEITKSFKEKIKSAGISKDWDIRPVLTSLTRSVEQNGVHRGSPDSVHQNGLGIDISYIRFDLIHKKSHNYLDLKNTKNRNALSIKRYAQLVMNQVLDELDKKGKLVFTNETKRGSHYHVSVI